MTDLYQKLGVSRTASSVEIRQAYARLAKERHPDRFPDPVRKEQAHADFQELTAAFNTLFNANTRREYDAQIERPVPTNPEDIARDAFERSSEALEGGDVQEAVTLLRKAVHHSPNEARYHHRLGQVLARNRAQREAVQSFEAAIKLAPREAAYHADLAMVFASLGMKIRAQKAVENALRLAPHDRRIQKIADDLGLGRS